MAVNVLATTFLGLEFLLFLISFSSATPKNLQYHVINSNKLTPEGSFVVKLDSHSRLRRQVDSSSSSSPGLTSDHSSQAQPAVTAGPSTNAPGDGAGSKPNYTIAPTTSSFQTSHGAANANEYSDSSAGTGSSTVAYTTIADPFADSDIIHDFHEYYTTDVLKGKGSEYWQELKDVPRHETLSTGHRVAAVIPLKFPFHFYGHEVTNVTVATGGFIYMSPFLHQWLTATQYIAPLMANFDPSLSEDSGVYYKNDVDKFTVEWKNVMLKDQNSSGNFSFQAILHKDDVIHFVYNSVPISVRGISTDEHPVKIGLSDAYYNDTYIPEDNITRRTIYEYHKVSVKIDTVKSGTVIVLKPLPDLQHHVINSNKLTTEGSFVVKLDSHSRLRRQVDSSSSSSPGLTPDHSSQAQPAVTAGPSTNAPGDGAGSKPNYTIAPTTSSFQTSHGAANANESSNSSAGTGSSTVASTTIADPFADSDIIHDFHEYYTTDVLKGKGSEYWQELKDVPRHETLSTGHRVAAVIPLKFPFHFYGHEVTNVTVATGGFIYMSPFLHQWLTATQYIAPLMANFDPSLSKDSGVYYKNDEDKFTVEWKNVMLKDQNSSGNFSFQAILHKDDVIHFVYNSVPISVRGISTDEHPVKIGLSDAYYNDTYIPEYKIKRRTIYEYHKVSVKIDTVKSGTVIVFKPLPTCNRLSDCNTCIKHVDVAFDCRWCNTIGRCSDGLDWYRQHWDKEGCQLSNLSATQQCTEIAPTTLMTLSSTNEPSTNTPTTVDTLNSGRSKEMNDCGHTNASEMCSSLPPPTKPITDPLNPSSQNISPQNPSTQKIRPQNSSSQSPSSQSPVSQSPNSKNLSSQNDCNHTKDSSDCASLPPPRKPIKDPLKGVETKNNCENGKCNKKSEFPVAVVVVVVLIVCGLLGSVGGWLYYAYTHPTSKSGMWLMEHRPSQIKANIKFWKNNSDAGTKYKVESET